MGLDLSADLLSLFRSIVDIESVSGNETALADAVQSALRSSPHLDVQRDGDAVMARTQLARAERVLIAGHLDTVPVAGNLPSELRTVDGEDRLYGRGTCDMKGGVAVQLALAASICEPVRDVTWIFYDHEEVDASLNGLGRLAQNHPDWLTADFAVLMEPTGARVEGGCQGTTRFEIVTRGTAAHSARAWLGHNAIHDVGDVLDRLNGWHDAEVEVEGLTYHEGMNAVRISGGVAGNVIPDECRIEINYRFAPDKSPEQALAHVQEVFDGYPTTVTDMSPAARPGLDQPAAAAFLAAVGGSALPKYGWTDVARFSALGIPAVNYGPADPGKAHADDEYCPVADLEICRNGLQRWLVSDTVGRDDPMQRDATGDVND